MSEILFDTLLEPAALSVVFQPIFDVNGPSPTLWGIEALTRGPKGTHFESAPILFDYVRLKGEEMRIDRRCISRAMADAARGEYRGLLSVNVHASTLERDVGFAAFIESAAVATETDPSLLMIEIVEKIPYFDTGRLLVTLRDLRSIGVRVAIDDFGLGNCNYRMILDTRPEVLKIDRYFVSGCATDSSRRTLLRSAHSLAAGLGAVTIAEGVETADDLATLQEIGIGLAQGFLLSTPMVDPAGIRDLLVAMPCRVAESNVNLGGEA